MHIYSYIYNMQLHYWYIYISDLLYYIELETYFKCIFKIETYNKKCILKITYDNIMMSEKVMILSQSNVGLLSCRSIVCVGQLACRSIGLSVDFPCRSIVLSVDWPVPDIYISFTNICSYLTFIKAFLEEEVSQQIWIIL
jgi:hypothetical protein